MMLSTLQDICDAEGLVWLWGDKAAFDKLVLDTDQTAEPVILYHEGFISGGTTLDVQGAFDTSYSLRLCLLVQSTFADTPDFRTPRFANLEPIMYRVLRRMSRTHRIVGQVSITEGINQTSTNLDGIRFSFTAIPKEPISVCLSTPVLVPITEPVVEPTPVPVPVEIPVSAD